MTRYDVSQAEKYQAKRMHEDARLLRKAEKFYAVWRWEEMQRRQERFQEGMELVMGPEFYGEEK